MAESARVNNLTASKWLSGACSVAEKGCGSARDVEKAHSIRPAFSVTLSQPLLREPPREFFQR